MLSIDQLSPTSSVEGPVDEIRSRPEVDTHVKRADVVSFDTHVRDPQALVELRLSLESTVSRVQDVRDPVPG